MHRLIKCLIIGVILTALALPACMGDDEVKIGTILPLTGDLSVYGPSMQQGVELAAKQINAEGGVLGKEIVLINQDSGTDPATGNDAMNLLVDVEEVMAVVGAAGSPVSKAIIDIAKDYKVVQISPSNTGTEFTTYDDDDFYYRTCPSDYLQGQAMAVLAQSKGYTTAVTLTVNNDYGIGFEEIFVDAFTDLGLTVNKQIHFEASATTFDSEVGQAEDANADVIVLICYPEQGAEILKKAYQTGALESSDWLLSEGLRSEELAELVGKDTEGNYIAAGLKGTTPDSRVAGDAYTAFVSAYQDEYGEKPGIFVENSYDAMVLLALAIEKAGEASGEAIKDAIRDIANAPGQEVSDVAEALDLLKDGKDINYQGASGELTIDINGDVSGSYCVWAIAASGDITLGDAIDFGE